MKIYLTSLPIFSIQIPLRYMLHNFKVNIAFFDVGQGDTTVISIPETKEAVIVDCVDAIAVFEYLEKQGIQHIRGLIVTHLHRDHCKEVVRFLDNCEPNWICERLMFNWPLLNNSCYAGN